MDRMEFEIVPARELSFGEQAKIFNEAFTGYLAAWKDMDADAFAVVVSSQGVDLCHSRFIRRKGETPIAFGYVVRTGNVSRLSAMGTVPAARRTGAAGSLLAHLLGEARIRGDEAMVLEVFEQNAPALALYRRQEFRALTRLFGWRSSGNKESDNSGDFREIAILHALRLPSALEYPELPWQVSRHAAAKVPSARAFGTNGAAIVIGDPTAEPIRVHAFLGFNGENWTTLRNILASVLARFPGKEFFAPAIFPEQFGDEIFAPLGFRREPLNQFLMRRDLRV